jgi:hypothetical protein
VSVSDGEQVRETWLDITITEENDPSSPPFMWMALVIMLAIMIAALVAMNRAQTRRLDDLHARLETPPAAETAGADGSAVLMDLEMQREVGKVVGLISNLPHSLPADLWGWDMSELAEEIVRAPRKEAPDGTPLARIRDRWYRADVEDLESFLKEFKE